MKIAVIGAGLMGRAAVYDLASKDDIEKVGIFDINLDLAREIGSKYGSSKAEPVWLDASDEKAAAEILKDYDAAISCVTYKYNPGLTKAAISAGCHFVDLGGNNDVVNTQLSMNSEAISAGVTVIPDSGLAPGMVSILAKDATNKLDKTTSIKIRVGGLPQSPRPPLNYQMVFSAEGLINEYWEPCLILENGKKKTVNPMTGVEPLEFDGIGELEAFYTSGGTSTLPDSFEDEIDFLDYKTIRYPGHCRLFKTMLEIGLASKQKLKLSHSEVAPRELFKAVLDNSLTYDGLDMVLVRLVAEGQRDGKNIQLTYEILDRQESSTSLTAMMRTTAFPAAILARMAVRGEITARGCKPQELIVNPAIFIAELRKRNINLEIKEKDI